MGRSNKAKMKPAYYSAARRGRQDSLAVFSQKIAVFMHKHVLWRQSARKKHRHLSAPCLAAEQKESANAHF
jgi:hypothetical protein